MFACPFSKGVVFNRKHDSTLSERGFFMEIILTKSQQEAIDFFEEYKYLVVEAPRRSGKTFLLQQIARMNPNKKIGVMCLGFNFFERMYGEFSNCRYIENLNSELTKPELIIGDEVLVEPKGDIPTACALTKRYIALRWGLDSMKYVTKRNLEEVRSQLSKEAYRQNFGQYE
jgi:hypothetical protein